MHSYLEWNIPLLNFIKLVQVQSCLSVCLYGIKLSSLISRLTWQFKPSSTQQYVNTSSHTKTLQQFWEQHDYTEICTANKSPRLALFPAANNKKQEKWKAKSKPFFFYRFGDFTIKSIARHLPGISRRYSQNIELSTSHFIHSPLHEIVHII